MTTTDNTLLWRPDSGRPHIESLFIKLFVPDSRQALWIQFGARTLRADVGAPYAHVMAARFDAGSPDGAVVVQRRVTATEVDARPDVLSVSLGGAVLEKITDEKGATRGRVTSGEHTIAWDLTWTSSGPPLRHLPWPMLYRTPLPRTKATSPAVDARFHGWFELDGERTEVGACPGMQGHNWGTQHAPRWLWTHGNAFTGDRPEAATSVFEALSAKLRVGPWTTPWLSVAYLRYGHTTLRLDTLRHPRSIHSRSRVEGLRWAFSCVDQNYRVEGVAEMTPQRIVGLHYENPDGHLLTCLNSSIATLEIEIHERSGGRWERVDTLRSAESSALEIGGAPARDDIQFWS